MLISKTELDSKRSRDLIPLECYQCGKTHYRTKNIVLRIMNGNHQNTQHGCFCSKECKYNNDKITKIICECKQCKKQFERLPKEIGKNIFCSKSCSAKYSNKSRIIMNKCVICNKEYHPYRGSKSMKYCSRKCFADYRRNIIYNKIENGTYKNVFSGNQILKKYLITKRGNYCENCQLSDWKSTNIPLTVHHIDGDAVNNIPSNLQLLCWNCHALTKNYGSKNSKSTRTYRYGASSENLTQASTLPK